MLFFWQNGDPPPPEVVSYSLVGDVSIWLVTSANRRFELRPPPSVDTYLDPAANRRESLVRKADVDLFFDPAATRVAKLTRLSTAEVFFDPTGTNRVERSYQGDVSIWLESDALTRKSLNPALDSSIYLDPDAEHSIVAVRKPENDTFLEPGGSVRFLAAADVPVDVGSLPSPYRRRRYPVPNWYIHKKEPGPWERHLKGVTNIGLSPAAGMRFVPAPPVRDYIPAEVKLPPEFRSFLEVSDIAIPISDDEEELILLSI